MDHKVKQLIAHWSWKESNWICEAPGIQLERHILAFSPVYHRSSAAKDGADVSHKDGNGYVIFSYFGVT